MPKCYANEMVESNMSLKGLILQAFYEVVPATGLEPVWCYPLEPESSASANSATRASLIVKDVSNGNYYARIKVNGKAFRQSLQRTAWTTSAKAHNRNGRANSAKRGLTLLGGRAT